MTIRQNKKQIYQEVRTKFPSPLFSSHISCKRVDKKQKHSNSKDDDDNDKKEMVRGNAKAIAQEKNAKKQAAKSQAKSTLGVENKSLSTKCSVCMQTMKSPKQLREHYESKHPKLPFPPEAMA